MDRFLVLTTTTERPFANKACALLEDAGIPVMMEHVEITQGNCRASGFKLLVPSQYTQTAMRLVDQASTRYQNRLDI